ncbi:MAG: hypothetical protein R3A46_09170 [Thermomicrobiales bacterium]
MSATISTFILLPFLLEDVNGLPTSRVGLVLLSQALVVTFLSRPVGKLADSYDAVVLSSVGLSIVLVIITILATVAVGWPIWALVPLLVVFGIGQASTFSPLQTTVTRGDPGTAGRDRHRALQHDVFRWLVIRRGDRDRLALARRVRRRYCRSTSGRMSSAISGDAFSYGFCALVGIVLLQFARRAPNVMEEEKPATVRRHAFRRIDSGTRRSVSAFRLETGAALE